MRLTPAKTPFRYPAVARGAHARKVAPPRYPEDSSSGLRPWSESSVAPIGVAAVQCACEIIPALRLSTTHLRTPLHECIFVWTRATRWYASAVLKVGPCHDASCLTSP